MGVSITPILNPSGGGTFRGVLPGARGGTFQSTIRPYVVIESFLKDRTPGPLDVPEQEAEIRWGKASNFQWSVTTPSGGLDARDVVYGSNDDDDSGDDEVTESATVEFVETNRVTETVRVTNPLDARDYVDVERILDITFSVPAGLAGAILQLRDGDISELFFKYILNHGDPA